MKALAALLLLHLPLLAAVPYCQPLVVQHGQVTASDQSNYVLTVNDTDPHLATVANGGYGQSQVGNDIVFTSDSQGQNLLNWDPLEIYNPVTGQLVTHVGIGTLSSTRDTTIYRCAGVPSSTFQGGLAGSAWPAGYVGVYHLGDGTTLNALDSSSALNNGTISGATASAGRIGGAAGITAVSAHITVPENMVLPFSVEAWVNIASITQGQVIVHMPGSYNDVYVYIDSSGFLHGYYGANCAQTSSVFATGSWQHVAGTFGSPGGPCTLYVNGVQAAAGTMTNQSQGALSPAVLGSTGSSLPLGGELDEVRITNTLLSGSRIQTDYNNQLNPLAFYVPGVWSTLQTTRTAGSQVFIF